MKSMLSVRRQLPRLLGVLLVCGLVLGLVGLPTLTAFAAAPKGQVIWLKALSNGKYVSADKNVGASAPLVADRSKVTSWEQFRVVDAGGGRIALKSVGTGKYVSVEGGGSNARLFANHASLSDREKFTWVDRGNGKVSLRANANNKYISVRGGHPSHPFLEAAKSQAPQAEIFIWHALAVHPTPTPTPTQMATVRTFANDFGTLQIFSTDNVKGIDLNNPFFQSLGTNGRSCNSCHKLENAMGISSVSINKIFDNTNGLDPLFRINDGSNAPSGYFSLTDTLAHRKASFSMLLAHGVIRVGIGVPAGADYSLAAVQDPYHFASAAELSLFRRPLPSVNVAFDTLTMWDGRESEGRPANRDALLNQANDATRGHAQAAHDLTDTQRAQIADFQLNLFAGQLKSKLAGQLTVAGCDIQAPTGDDPGEDCGAARGGAVELAKLLTDGSEDFPPFAPGINDSFNNPDFNHTSFILFEPWESLTLGPNPTVGGILQQPALTSERGNIGDGENLFYTKQFNISGVAGLNDVLGQAVVVGTCTTCHNTPDVGNHSQPRFFRIGIESLASDDNALAGNLADFPQYTFQRNSDHIQVTTTDPGLALRTGQFADIGRFKVPNLRGLGSRAPYFHNGAANSLQDVLKFYNRRFSIGFTQAEIDQIVLFLQQN